MGAYDYIHKPFNVEELKIVVLGALERRRLRRENVLLKRALGERHQFSNIIGRSESMLAVFELIETIAQTSSTVLVTGESGTGKELVARAIHFNSARKDRPFVAVNCGALTETLLESELFGHVRGAFTGAATNKKGLFEVADRGTIFLDEIGEMSPLMQVKLLRVLQERVVPAGRRHRRDRGRRPHHHRDQPRPGADGRGGQVPRGPLLPDQRDSAAPAAAARARRGHPDPRRALPHALRGGAGEAGAGPRRREPVAAGAVPLAGQHPRARERDGARRRARADAGHPAAEPARGRPRRRRRRPGDRSRTSSRRTRCRTPASTSSATSARSSGSTSPRRCAAPTASR